MGNLTTLGEIAGIIVAAFTAVRFAWEWWDRRTSSRVTGIVNLNLPAVPEALAIFQPLSERLLFGRGEHTRQLRLAVERNRLLFVSGQSGVGKSTLLKVGLCRELYESRRWLPIVIDV
jgi:hypothetical protein